MSEVPDSPIVQAFKRLTEYMGYPGQADDRRAVEAHLKKMARFKREDAIKVIAGVKEAWSDEPITSKMDRREIDDLADAIVAVVNGGAR